jgi:hypothetical protein
MYGMEVREWHTPSYSASADADVQFPISSSPPKEAKPPAAVSSLLPCCSLLKVMMMTLHTYVVQSPAVITHYATFAFGNLLNLLVGGSTQIPNPLSWNSSSQFFKICKKIFFWTP